METETEMRKLHKISTRSSGEGRNALAMEHSKAGGRRYSGGALPT